MIKFADRHLISKGHWVNSNLNLSDLKVHSHPWYPASGNTPCPGIIRKQRPLWTLCNLTADAVEGGDLVPVLHDPGRPSDETMVYLWPQRLGQGQADDTVNPVSVNP